MFTITIKELKEYIAAEVAPTIVEEATSAAIKRAYETQQSLTKALIIAGVSVFVAFLGIMGYFVSLMYNILSRLSSP